MKRLKWRWCLMSMLLALGLLFYLPVCQAKFVRVGNTQEYREHHKAILLDDGRVLVVGGTVNGKTAEVYDPQTRKFQLLPKMQAYREDPALVKLQDGRVLIMAGYDGSLPWGLHREKMSDLIEIFDPKLNQFSAVGHLPRPSHSITTTLLPNNQIMVTMGQEIYMMNTQTFIFVRWGDFVVKRYWPQVSLMSDGRILIVGGIPSSHSFEELSSAEIVDPESKEINLVNYKSEIRMKPNHNESNLFLLNKENLFLHCLNGYFLISSSGKIVEKLEGRNLIRSKGANAVLLKKGKVLLTGGERMVTGEFRRPNQSELFDPETKAFKLIGPMCKSRAHHTTTLLKDGTVLILGGDAPLSMRWDYPKHSTAELYIEDKITPGTP